MKKILFIFALCIGCIVKAQVGIGTTTPNATLDIQASNQAAPANTDGILIPKVDNLPSTNPTNAQDGMLVFVTGNGTDPRGFYFWDQSTTSWLNLTGAKRIDDLVDGINNNSSIFLGQYSGLNNDGLANRNIGLGNFTLSSNVSGERNVAIGDAALNMNIQGNSNIAIGDRALLRTRTAGNIGIGVSAITNNFAGSGNIGIGGFCLLNNIDGNKNIAIGSLALRENQSGNNNIAIGENSGYNTLGSNNIFIGFETGYNETGDYKLYIDNSNTPVPLIYGEFDNDLLRINGTLDVNNAYQFPLTDGAANQVLQTDGAGVVSWQTPADTDSINNLVDGVSDDDGTNNGSSIFLGINAGIADDESDNQNVGIGYQSMSTNTFGSSNTAVGYEALTTNSTGSNNVAVGRQSLFTNATGQNNTAIGANALSANNSASNNTAIGSSSLSSLTGLLSTGNVAIGPGTLESSTSGRYNTVIGDNALNDNTSGEQNVVIGAFAGNNNASGNGNVFIGYTAGTNEFNSNRLYIENSTASSPLIGGDFNLNRVGINRPIVSLSNTFEVGGTASKAVAGAWLANSDKRLKKNIEQISGSSALDRLMKLKGVSYFWNDNKTGLQRPEHIQYGFVAQNIQEVFPEKVTQDALGYLQTAYGDYDAFFVEAIKELKTQLDQKQAEINTLKKELQNYKSLEARIEALEAYLKNE